MEAKDSRTSSVSSSVLDWSGPHTILIPHSGSDFGFTLRHLVVYPPQSTRPDIKDDRVHLSRGESSLEPFETIFVKSVKEGSPANQAGLQTGDRLLAVNGQSVSGRGYQEVIETIQQSDGNLQLLVLPQDEDILQMAYQSRTRDSVYGSSSSLSSDNTPASGATVSSLHQYSNSDLTPLGSKENSFSLKPIENLPATSQDNRHSYPASNRGLNGSELRCTNSLTNCTSEPRISQGLASDDCLTISVTDTSRVSKENLDSMSQDVRSNMSSHITCNIPSRSKYSFGLYFPPKSSVTMSSSASSHNVSADNPGKASDGQPKRLDVTRSRTVEVSQRQLGSTPRKTSLDENSALTSSAKSREFFIRYSSDRAANDTRYRYFPRYSAYEQYSSDSRPACIMSRSQTISTITPSSSGDASSTLRISPQNLKSNQLYTSDTSKYKYIPVISENKQQKTSGNTFERKIELGGLEQRTASSDRIYPTTGSRTFELSIPYGQQQQQQQQQCKVTESSSPHTPQRQRYGTTYAVTRTPTAAHIEIQKSIGKPIVSQRKYQFEVGRNMTAPLPSLDGQSQLKSEIDKIRNQARFSSVALRKASFEQSPDRDPPGYNDPVDYVEQPMAHSGFNAECSQPTVKVRKISAESYNLHGSPHVGSNLNSDSAATITILVSPENTTISSSTPISLPTRADRALSSLEADVAVNPAMSRDGYYSSSPVSHEGSTEASLAGGAGCGTGVTASSGLADSGVWMKSCHSSSDMLDGPDEVGVAPSNSTAPEEVHGVQKSESAQMTFICAVNAAPPAASGLGASTGSVTGNSVPTAGLTHASTVSAAGESSELPETADIGPNSPFHPDRAVSMRKKLQDSLEDQASKLHRRTSYLMATARDRTNTVPLEETFSTTPDILHHKTQPVAGTARRNSSVKLNKFFGEMIPSIIEGVEMKSKDYEETPEIIRKGPLSYKLAAKDGKKHNDRTWKQVYAILRPSELFLTHDKEASFTSSHSEERHIPLKSCMVECAREYIKKKKNVFRLSCQTEPYDFLFQTEDKGMMMCWIQGIKSSSEADKGEDSISSETYRGMQSPIEINIIPSSKTSPQLTQKAKKSALSFKSKLVPSPNMKRKKSNVAEKDKEENLKKGWKDRIPMMKSLKKHSEDSSLTSAEQEVDSDKFQFGVPLEDCFPSPHNEFVPLIVELCTRIVEARGLEVIGVYRVPGNSAAVTALIEEFNRGIDSVNIDNEKLLDINVISSLLKSFFRRLPEPLIPTDMYESFIEANRYPDEDKRKLKIKRLLHILPAHHNETLKHMAEHLNKVASYGNINKMDAKNLAIMFGPTLVRKKGDDTVSLVTDMSDQCRIVESIILHHDWFFSPWDQDSYIPMETTVETVPVEDGQNLSKDDDEEADSAISTKEIISSIVGAASKKLRQQQQQKSLDSLDMVDCGSTYSSSTFRDHSLCDTSFLTSFNKSMTSMNSSLAVSEEQLGHKSSMSSRYLESLSSEHNTSAISDFTDFSGTEIHDTSSVSVFSQHRSNDSLHDKNDELEISHSLSASLSQDAINRLKRIGEDVSALLYTLEQKQDRERERRRQEKELVEREHFLTQLELEQEDDNNVDDWLAWESGLPSLRVPDLVSSSFHKESLSPRGHYSGFVAENQKGKFEKSPRQDSKLKVESPSHSLVKVASVSPQKAELTVREAHSFRRGSHEDVLCRTKPQGSDKSVAMPKSNQPGVVESQQKISSQSVAGLLQRPSSIRNSLGRRHASLDSLIDLIDKQDKRISWVSTDSEDGSDLLTSITATFDQKLEILLNPKYKLSGGSKKTTKNESSLGQSTASEAGADSDPAWQVRGFQSRSPSNLKQVFAAASLLESDRSFRDPSLHRSARSDPKIGIASRFERSDIVKATPTSVCVSSSSSTSSSSSSTSVVPLPSLGQQSKVQEESSKFSLVKVRAQPSKITPHVVLSQPRKLESSTAFKVGSDRTSLQLKDTAVSPQQTSPSQPTSNANQPTSSTETSTRVEQRFENGSKLSAGRLKTRPVLRKVSSRRYTVGGIEDFLHDHTLSHWYGEGNTRVCSAFGYQLPPFLPRALKQL